VKFVALCGAPGSGKTEVQKFLASRYGMLSADDGHPIRDFAMKHFGMSRWHVYTQEGKASNYVLPGGVIKPVRVVLGEIGNMIEAIAGPDAIPEMAIGNCDGGTRYSFGSCRRSQGHVYKQHGALVLEIKRPFCRVINEFDQYDASCVDHTINNDSSVAILCERVAAVVEPYLETT
jgi:hypothetical protein